MFYDGDIQGGIAAALKENKSVTCFVRDDTEESLLWENDYLKDEELARQLSTKSYVLRIQNGTQEASWLQSFVAFDKAPTVIMIRNGLPRQFVPPYSTKEQVKNRILAGLEEGEGLAYAEPQHRERAHETNDVTGTAATASADAQGASSSSSPSKPKPKQPTKSKSSSSHPEKEIPPKANPESRPAKDDKSKQTDSQSHLNEQKRRKNDAKEERKRILRLVEADKEERRRKAEEERRLRQGANQSEAAPSKPQHNPISPPSKAARSSKCALQIRMMQGETVRRAFDDPYTATIRTNVRPWIDKERTDGDTPYTLKHIKSPLPNRTIELTEEDYSLSEMGLTPNATLVMVPLPRQSRISGAYDGSAGQSWLGWGIGLPFRAVAGTAGVIGGVLGLTGPEAQQDSAAPLTTEQRAVNIRTLNDQRREGSSREPDQSEGRHKQLYNGNQLNFEPRKNDDDD